MTEASFEMQCRYYKLELANEVLHEIDVEHEAGSSTAQISWKACAPQWALALTPRQHWWE